MEIEINNTSATNDDLVELKCEHPAHRHIVDCRIRATTNCPTSSTVVLTNPDGRLRFPNAGDATTTVTVPGDGSWAAFQISGERGSDAIGDAVIEAHCNTATGDVKARKGVTVFWFDDLHINVTPGGAYASVGGQFTPTGGNGVNHSAQARIRPAGVDCAAPQIRDLRVGIIQTMLTWPRRRTWTAPAIAWNAGVAPGTRVTVPTTIRMDRVLPAAANDTAAAVDPLYDQPGKGATTIDANSLKPPNGCAGGAAATSNDSPALAMPATFAVPAESPPGTVVGNVTYRTFVRGTLDATFLTWIVIFNVTSNELCALRERNWAVNVTTDGGAGQKATAGAADRAPTRDPVATGRSANDIGNDPANQSTVPVGAATTTFTR